MSRFRRSKLALAAALILLSFTTVDLVGDVVAYPLCASDLEHGSEATGTDELGDSGEPDGSIPDAAHIDDCFCCSRCVEYSLSFDFSPRTRIVLNDSVPPASFAFLLPYELYRPPRLS